MRKRKAGKPENDKRRVVRLEDLAPQTDVKGGAGKVLFGERFEVPEREGGLSEKDRGKPKE